MSAMPRPSEATREFFQSVLPADDRVQVRPMFGQLAGFVNGHMFSGIFGDDVFVRPSESDLAVLLDEPGAGPFEPMGGRPMKGYVVLPAVWRGEPARVRDWVQRAMVATAALPPKERKPAARRSPATRAAR